MERRSDRRAAISAVFAEHGRCRIRGGSAETVEKWRATDGYGVLARQCEDSPFLPVRLEAPLPFEGLGRARGLVPPVRRSRLRGEPERRQPALAEDDRRVERRAGGPRRFCVAVGRKGIFPEGAYAGGGRPASVRCVWAERAPRGTAAAYILSVVRSVGAARLPERRG